MRRWQDLAAPDDPGSWYDVGRMWPTRRGTYETADTSTATNFTATGAGTVRYALATRTLDGTIKEYVVAGKIWEGGLTDRTGGVSIGSAPMGAQFGSVTILVMGVGVATVAATSGNFAALAGAPEGEIIVVQSNAVVIFNTNASVDGWHASDVGDHTNWSTGESASGRIIQTPGPITAAVAYGNDIYVFKKDAIYRMTYVGGLVKWQVQLVWRGVGVGRVYTADKYQAVACHSGIAFRASSQSGTACEVYLFDGASEPQRLNPVTSLTRTNPDAVFLYNPVEDVLTIAPGNGPHGSLGTPYYYYSFPMQAWGSGTGASEEASEDELSEVGSPIGVMQGDYWSRAEPSSKPVYWRYRVTAGNAIYRCAPTTPSSTGTCYLQSTKIGQSDGKTLFSRLIPQLRRRTDLGTDSAALSFELFSEREDTSAAITRSVTESTDRKRFDLLGGASEATFGRFKVTWTGLDVEVDDFMVKSKSRVDTY